jgi:hypothetical protein
LGQVTVDTGQLLHRAGAVLLFVVLTSLVGLGALGARLSQGPINITWLARHMTPRGVDIGNAVLAWEGWRQGLDRPLDIRLSGLLAEGPTGATLAFIPQARVSISFAWLLVGRVVPRAIELDGARLRAVRGVDGRITTVLGSLDSDSPDGDPGADPFGAILAEFSKAAQTDATTDATTPRWEAIRWSQLRLVRIADAQAIMTDRQLGVVWRAPAAMLELTRLPAGGVSGHATITLAVGQQTTRLTATLSLSPDGTGTTVHGTFSPIAPASLAGLSPALAGLRALDAPLSGAVDLALDRQFEVISARLVARIAAGTLRIGASAVPLTEGTFDVRADHAGVAVTAARAVLAAPGHGAGAPVITAHGGVKLAAQNAITGRVSLAVDQVGFADLAQYWPAELAPNARDWLVTNITAGTARAAHAELAFAYDGSAGLQVTGASGGLRGDDLTINWLRPVPPVEHVQAALSVVSPDALLITTSSGHQTGGDLRTGAGTMRILGLSQKDQTASLDLNLTGSVADAWALLHHPRLNVLSRHKVGIDDPTGQITSHLHLDMPLDTHVTIDQIGLHAQGQLASVHLTAVGRSVDQGALDFDVTGDGLKLGGKLQFAGIPAQLTAGMDFRDGPANQVQMRVALSGEASIDQWAAAGLDSYGLLSGRAALTTTLEEHRDGAGQVSVHADLRNTGMRVGPMGWHRDAGGAAQGDAHILLDHDAFAGIDRLSLEGDGVSVLGRADASTGPATTLRLERVQLGETDATGTLRFGPAPDRKIEVTLSGPRLDLSGRFAKPAPEAGRQESGKPAEHQGPPWAVDLRFGQVFLAGHRALSGVAVQAEDDGHILRRAALHGSTGKDAPFSLTVEPEPGGRRLVGEAADGGALLAASDIAQVVLGGQLTVRGHYDDQSAAHALTGTADLTHFEVRNAPAAAKLLQAMTLYGLVDALRGPGLDVERLILPFRKLGGVIEITDARAFSPSLGVTAKGRVDLVANTADLQGTIVPAYFFNTLLGGLPLVGPLFSPEKGGGLFAATYYVTGKLDEPSVGVNPLSVLTPGFLRGVFGIFDAPDKK